MFLVEPRSSTEGAEDGIVEVAAEGEKYARLRCGQPCSTVPPRQEIFGVPVHRDTLHAFMFRAFDTALRQSPRLPALGVEVTAFVWISVYATISDHYVEMAHRSSTR
jgi:hypothetical protein